MKVAIIGAGNVGATLAMRVLESGLADVVLVDKYENIAKGKALDLSDASPIVGHGKNISGTGDYSCIKGSKVVVITAGFPRRPGMAREELISQNSKIVKEVAETIKIHAPDAVIIVVTNPLDAMAYLTYKVVGFDHRRVIGMAGVLDCARLKHQVSTRANVSPDSVETLVLGSHGDTMVPIISHTKIGSDLISKALPEEKRKEIVKSTRDRGAEIVSLLGSGSAFYSPSAATFKMVEAVLKDTKEVMVASAYLDGEYGLKDIYIGVPVKIGSQGIESIVEIEMSDGEKAALLRSAEVIRATISSLQ